MDHKPVQLKQAANKRELTNWENITNKDRIINSEILPADHLTKKFILNPVEGSSYKNSKPTPWFDNEDKVLESAPHICIVLQTDSYNV